MSITVIEMRDMLDQLVTRGRGDETMEGFLLTKGRREPVAKVIAHDRYARPEHLGLQIAASMTVTDAIAELRSKAAAEPDGRMQIFALGAHYADPVSDRVHSDPKLGLVVIRRGEAPFNSPTYAAMADHLQSLVDGDPDPMAAAGRRVCYSRNARKPLAAIHALREGAIARPFDHPSASLV